MLFVLFVLFTVFSFVLSVSPVVQSKVPPSIPCPLAAESRTDRVVRGKTRGEFEATKGGIEREGQANLMAVKGVACMES